MVIDINNRVSATLMISGLIFLFMAAIYVFEKYGSKIGEKISGLLNNAFGKVMLLALQIVSVIQIIWLLTLSNKLFPGLDAALGFLVYWPFLVAMSFLTFKSWKQPNISKWIFILLFTNLFMARILVSAIKLN